jgi:hypothetical protein
MPNLVIIALDAALDAALDTALDAALDAALDTALDAAYTSPKIICSKVSELTMHF